MDKIIPVLKEELVEDHFNKLLLCLGLSIDKDGILQEIDDPSEGSYEQITTNQDLKLMFPLESYLKNIDKFKETIPFNPVTDKPHNSKYGTFSTVVHRVSNTYQYLIPVLGQLVLLFLEQQENINAGKTDCKDIVDPELIEISVKFAPSLATLRSKTRLFKDYKKLINKWLDITMDDSDPETGAKVVGILCKEIFGKTDMVNARGIMTLDSPLYARLKQNDRDDFEINGKKLSRKETRVFSMVFELILPCLIKEPGEGEEVEKDLGRYSVLSKSDTNPVYECLIRLLIETLPRMDRMLKGLDDYLGAKTTDDYYNFRKEKFNKKDLEVLEELDSYINKRVDHYYISKPVNTNKENDMVNTNQIYQQNVNQAQTQYQQPQQNFNNANSGFNQGQTQFQETEEQRARRLLGLNDNPNAFGGNNSFFVRKNPNIGTGNFFDHGNREYSPYGNSTNNQYFVNRGGNMYNREQELANILSVNGINPYERLVLQNIGQNGMPYEAIPTNRDQNGNWYDQFGQYIHNSTDANIQLWELSQELANLRSNGYNNFQRNSYQNNTMPNLGTQSNRFYGNTAPQTTNNNRYIPGVNDRKTLEKQNQQTTFQFGGSNSTLSKMQNNNQQTSERITNINQLPKWDQQTMISSVLEFTNAEIKEIEKIIKDNLGGVTLYDLIKGGEKVVSEFVDKMVEVREANKFRALKVMSNGHYLLLFKEYTTIAKLANEIVTRSVELPGVSESESNEKIDALELQNFKLKEEMKNLRSELTAALEEKQTLGDELKAAIYKANDVEEELATLDGELLSIDKAKRIIEGMTKDDLDDSEKRDKLTSAITSVIDGLRVFEDAFMSETKKKFDIDLIEYDVRQNGESKGKTIDTLPVRSPIEQES